MNVLALTSLLILGAATAPLTEAQPAPEHRIEQQDTQQPTPSSQPDLLRTPQAKTTSNENQQSADTPPRRMPEQHVSWFSQEIKIGDLLNLATFIVTAFFLRYTYKTWQTMLTANAIAERNAKKAEADSNQNAKDAAENLRLTRESNDLTRDSSEVALRAWVGIERIEDFRLRFGVGELKVRISNTGHSPAGDVRVALEWHIRPDSLPEDEPINPEGQVLRFASAIWAGQGLTYILLGPNLTQDTIEKIQSGALKFYFRGCVTYLDVFGKRRETYFCSVRERDCNLWNFSESGNRFT